MGDLQTGNGPLSLKEVLGLIHGALTRTTNAFSTVLSEDNGQQTDMLSITSPTHDSQYNRFIGDLLAVMSVRVLHPSK